MKELIRETVLGNLFWTLFQALAPMIWFYPLNELEISGYEAFAVVLFSPLLVGLPYVGRFLCSRWPIALFRLISVASLASFQASSTLQRLVILCLGCFCVMIVFCASIFSSSATERCRSAWGLVLGLLAFVTSRIWLTSFVPAWWTFHSNIILITITAIAVNEKLLSGEDSGIERQTKSSVGRKWIPLGFGFGSLLYVTQAVFGEVSVVCRWVVKGYPETGPMPFPWGAAVLIALCFGVSLSPCGHVTKSYWWWLIGGAGFLALYHLPTWAGFTGGLVLAVFIMSIWPEMISRLALCPPAKTVSLAVLVWLVETLFSVWTVAYNFVPGGEFTRERTSWLVVAVIISLGLGLFMGPQVSESYKNPKGEKMPDRKAIIHRSNKESLYLGLITSHWSTLGQTGEMIGTNQSMENVPQICWIGEWLSVALGEVVFAGRGSRRLSTDVPGSIIDTNLILSKYPFVKSVHHLLPSPHGELAPAVTATVNITGQLVDFVVTHMGNDRDVIDRKLQAKFLSTELKNAVNPVVFLGYVTSAPFSRDYLQLTKGGNVKDIDDTDKDRWCEYIMYRGLTRLGYARISHGGLSDTEIQVGRFHIPDHPNNAVDHSRMVKDPADIDEEIRFSSRFGSYADGHNWIQDHRYHMSTPKYFLPQSPSHGPT